MLLWILSFALFTTTLFAEVGKISKLVGSGDGYLVRNHEKIILSSGFLLEKGDEIFTLNNVLVIHLYPMTQMGLSKNTQIKISESLIEEDEKKDKSFSVIDFVKGLVRIQVTKDENTEVSQKVQANGVAFAVRGTEFEISQDGEDFDLDVIEGEVEVSSPNVQTFVPEIVKAHQGFRYNSRGHNFQRRNFAEKFKNHPGFIRNVEIREKWMQKRQGIRQRRMEQGGNHTTRQERFKGQDDRMNDRRQMRTQRRK